MGGETTDAGSVKQDPTEDRASSLTLSDFSAELAEVVSERNATARESEGQGP